MGKTLNVFNAGNVFTDPYHHPSMLLFGIPAVFKEVHEHFTHASSEAAYIEQKTCIPLLDVCRWGQRVAASLRLAAGIIGGLSASICLEDTAFVRGLAIPLRVPEWRSTASSGAR